MNRPIIRIVATDGKAYPLAQGTASEPSPSAGAVPTPSHGAQPSNLRAATGEAEGFSPVPSVSPTFPCRHCNGEGEAEYMGLTEDRYHWRTCHICEGSRVEAPYCTRCDGNLTVDFFCRDCDDYADGFAPAGWNAHQFIAGIVTVDGNGVARVEL